MAFAWLFLISLASFCLAWWEWVKPFSEPPRETVTRDETVGFVVFGFHPPKIAGLVGFDPTCLVVTYAPAGSS